LEQLGKNNDNNNNIIIHVKVQQIVSRNKFDSQLADIAKYVKNYPDRFIGQQITKAPNESELGTVMEYTKDEKGDILSLVDDTDVPIDTFIGALRQYYFDAIVDGLTQDLWCYLQRQIDKSKSEMNRLDEDIKELEIDRLRVDTNELMLRLLKVIQDIELSLLFSANLAKPSSYISYGGVCTRARGCCETLKKLFREMHDKRRAILANKSIRLVNKPMFDVGDFVNAKWSPSAYKRGVVKSYEEDDEEDDGYGPHRVYKVEFDNGITRENIEDYQIDEHPEADWMNPSK